MKSAANTRVAIVADDVAEPQDIQVITVKDFIILFHFIFGGFSYMNLLLLIVYVFIEPLG